MLPPVLEVFVVWHPNDAGGRVAAEQLVSHFHGTSFSGLIGGAIEIYARSDGWTGPGDAPRPIPFPGDPPPNGVAQAQLTVVVPVLGNAFAAAAEAGGPWLAYAQRIAAARLAAPERVRVLPIRLDPTATAGTNLGLMFNPIQAIGQLAEGAFVDDEAGRRCRDLAQGITQWASGNERLTVFISHTKKNTSNSEEDVAELTARVRAMIANTRLAAFFDAQDLQPGEEWETRLRTQAATGALLALRTDLYASREWCQREMVIAKISGLPVVILDSLGIGEERGSYLLDHVPRIPVQRDAAGWNDAGILRCLNLLVDESLKRALWRRQRALAVGIALLDVSWWAPHAPELLTLVEWIERQRNAGSLPDPTNPLRILHPDPPLGPEEVRVLQQFLALAGVASQLEVMTPRMLAARGG